jgi:hypothetical protein
LCRQVQTEKEELSGADFVHNRNTERETMTQNNINEVNYTQANIFQNYPDIVTTNQMIEMLHIGRNKAYELLNNNEIRSIKIGKTGRTHYITKINIIAYLNRKSITS